MKPYKILIIIIVVIGNTIMGTTQLSAQIKPSGDKFSRWKDTKFGMFIHWGLYSETAGFWDATLGSRSGYFSKRFKKVVKEPFGLDKNYGLYSFRHTFIPKLYRYLVIETSPFAAKSVLMQIIGYATMSALEKDLRDIDAELPKDY